MRLALPLRWLTLALLLLALWNPQLSPNRAALDLTLIAPMTDTAAHARLLQSLRLDTADDETVINWYTLDSANKNLAAVLEKAVAERAGQHGASALLLAGADTELELAAILRKAKDRGIASYWLPRPAVAAHTPVRIDAVNAPQRIDSAAVLPVTVRLSAAETGPYRVTVSAAGSTTQQSVILESGQTRNLRLWLNDLSGGHHTLLVNVSRDQQTLASHRSSLSVMAPGLLVLISAQQRQLPDAITARRPFKVLTPTQVGANQPLLQQATTIVLDNIAITSLSQRSWDVIADRVRLGGAALWALGGDSSFAAGGYRGSILESLLPVVSEPAADKPAATVVFLLDHSGSMGAGSQRPTPLQQARAAIQLSSASLADTDTTALVAFAETAEMLAPLQANGAHVPPLGEQTLQPQGSTNLSAGLGLALEQLAQGPAHQRLLVVVTDGFTGDFDPAPWRQSLQAAQVKTLILALGTDPVADSLQGLLWSDQGQLLRVPEPSQLPALMQQAVTYLRLPSAGSSDVSLTAAAAASALDIDYAWPPVSNYQPTRAKPAATTYLRANGGEPLAATIAAGAGNAIALPAGLYDWVPAWREWNDLAAALQGLTSASGQALARASISLEPQQQGADVRVLLETDDTVDHGTASLTLFGLGGDARPVAMERLASGVFEYRYRLVPAGNYLFTATYGDTTVSQAFVQQQAGSLSKALASGLIKDWHDRDLRPRSASTELRRPFVLAALFSFLCALLSPPGPDRHSRQS